MAALEATIVAGVETVQENLPGVLAAAVEQCRAEHEEALDELADLGCRLEGVVRVLGEVVETGATEMLGASEGEVRQTETTQRGLDELLSALGRVKAQLASYTFVAM